MDEIEVKEKQDEKTNRDFKKAVELGKKTLVTGLTGFALSWLTYKGSMFILEAKDFITEVFNKSKEA